MMTTSHVSSENAFCHIFMVLNSERHITEKVTNISNHRGMGGLFVMGDGNVSKISIYIPQLNT